MYNTSEAKCLGSARAAQNYDGPKAVRIPEIPEALEQLKRESDVLNDALNDLSARLGPVRRVEPLSPSDCEKEPQPADGLLEPILRIRRSLGCATNQVRAITSTLMV